MLAQFTQPDTWTPNPRLASDWNRYTYVRNNPVNYTDPTGHCSEFVASTGECKFYGREWTYTHQTRGEVRDELVLTGSEAQRFNSGKDLNRGQDHIDVGRDPLCVGAGGGRDCLAFKLTFPDGQADQSNAINWRLFWTFGKYSAMLACFAATGGGCFALYAGIAFVDTAISGYDNFVATDEPGRCQVGQFAADAILNFGSAGTGYLSGEALRHSRLVADGMENFVLTNHVLVGSAV